MNGAVKLLWLLAAREDSFRVWGRFDHERPGFGLTEMLLVAGAAAILAIAALVSYIVAKRRKNDFWWDNSSRLFNDMCRAHRLEVTERRLLKKLAAAQGVDSPIRLFVEPDYFEATNLPAALKPSAAELRQLRHELFE